MSNTDIQERCVELAKTQVEQLADRDHPQDRRKALDVEYSVSAEGDIREITITTATGGPHVEVELFNEVVSVSWGSDSVRRIIQDDDALQSCEYLAQFYKSTAHFT